MFNGPLKKLEILVESNCKLGWYSICPLKIYMAIGEGAVTCLEVDKIIMALVEKPMLLIWMVETQKNWT